MEVHVFDFDGTIFYSPSPNETAVRRLYGHQMLGQLRSPVQSGGLGWFQSLSSMSPPAVPHAPDLQSWYVDAVLRRMHELGAGQHTSSDHKSDGQGGEDVPAVRLYVMTGRDVKYRARITHLLDHAGVLPYITEIFLKPHETAGTVRYKLDTLAHLVSRHHPRAMYYYEDRPDQGGRLLEGMRCYQRELYPTLLPRVTVMVLEDEAGREATAAVDTRAEQERQTVRNEEEDGTARQDDARVMSGNVVSRATTAAASQGDTTDQASEAPAHSPAQPPSSPGSSAVVTQTTTAADHSCPAPRYMTVQELFGHDRGAQRRAERQAEEWVMRSFATSRGRGARTQQYAAHHHNYNNNSNNNNASSRHRGGRYSNAQHREAHVLQNAGQAAGATGTGDGSSLHHASLDEDSPAPFTFTLVMMPERVQTRSAQMLSDAELQMLVAALQVEAAQATSSHASCT